MDDGSYSWQFRDRGDFGVIYLGVRVLSGGDCALRAFYIYSTGVKKKTDVAGWLGLRLQNEVSNFPPYIAVYMYNNLMALVSKFYTQLDGSGICRRYFFYCG